MKKTWIAIGLIIAIGVICYANSFSNPFIWDDQNLVVDNPYIKDIRLIKNIFTKDLAYGTQFSNFYRPLQSLSFELDYYIWGLNPFGFHLSNFLFHAAAAVVVFLMLSLLFPTARFAPLITALFFIVHPIQTEAVTYISGRADSMAALFMFLAVFFYLKHSRNQKIMHISLATICFIFALLSKETALILPFLILLVDVSFPENKLSFKKKLKSCYLPFIVVTLVYVMLRATVLNFLDRPLFIANAPLSLRMMTSAKTFVIYLRLLVLPFNLHMERSLPFVTSIMDKGVIASLGILTASSILIARSYKRSRGLFFAGAWFFLTLLPVSNLVPINSNMAEHWLYLPSIGFFLLIAQGAEKLLTKRKAIKLITAILLISSLAFYSYLTIKRNQDWRDPETFFKDILKYSPKSSEAHNSLGAVYKKSNQVKLAAAQFKLAIEADPNNYKAYGNLGSALREQKRYNLAISAYKKAIRIRSDIPGLYNNLGNVYADNDDWQEAKEMFDYALTLYPEFALAYINLGKVYYSTGKIDLAIKQYRRAVELHPDLLLARYNLGVAYYKKGEYEKAKENFLEVLRSNPSSRHSQSFLKRIEKLEKEDSK